MSVYLDRKRKGWRYEFILNKKRYSSRNFNTKTEAKAAEAEERKVIKENRRILLDETTLIDMDFLSLCNNILDYLEGRRSERHFNENKYLFRRWCRKEKKDDKMGKIIEGWNWGKMPCSEITTSLIDMKLQDRKQGVSAHAANKDLRHLRALFNRAIKLKLLSENPTTGIEFFPVERKPKHVPPKKDIEKVISMADPGTQEYLSTIRDTMARVSEINALKWEDVNLELGQITLYTRKKKGGNRTPRVIPMTDRLKDIMNHKFNQRDPSIPWVFWHRYWSRKDELWVNGPYQHRKSLMKNLCKKADVRPFGFHALRHSGASIMDMNNVPIGSIQRLLGHENRSTTEIYLHSIGQAEKDAIDTYEKATEKVTHKVTHNPHTGYDKKQGPR